MESVIHELYAGRLHPHEQPLPNTEEYQENLAFYKRTREKFENRLRDISEELLQQYEDIKHYQYVMGAIELEDMFGCGFRLGLRLMTESLYQEN